MIANRQRTKSLMAFFLLTFALAVPFWVLGALIGGQLMPGLPVAGLMFVCPGLAALVLVRREHGFAGVRALVVRAFDYKGVTAKIWYAPVVLLNPVIFALSYVVLGMRGVPVPDPQIQILPVLALCAVFFVAALGEELGRSGYALDPMQSRWGALGASLLLGGAWAIFHFVALVQAHRSWEWIGWWSLWTVSARHRLDHGFAGDCRDLVGETNAIGILGVSLAGYRIPYLRGLSGLKSSDLPVRAVPPPRTGPILP